MPKKPANPNTAYGRKRLRQDHQEWKESLTPEERSKVESDNNGCMAIIWVVVVAACIVAYLAGGSSGLLSLLKVMSH